MKKILLPILALGGLLFASSCQMDEPDAGTLTGEVDFSITAGIPAGITTYSPDDGKAFSHLGGINNVTGDYVLRFILEVYDGNAVAYKEIKYLDDFSNPNVTFNPRLLAKEYDFVFWADFVAKGDSEENRGDLYYNTSNGLTTISYKDNVTATVLTTDLVDAYYANENVNLTQSSQSLQVTLQRPFGKIRLLATDNPVNPVDMANTTATITFKEVTTVPNTFNALTDEASESEPFLSVTGYTFNAINETKPVVTDHSLTSAYLLGQTYFFGSPSSTAYDMTVTVRNGDTQIGHRELTNIPVSANKLTTVIGNFYTNEGNIDVIVEDDFGSGEVEIDIWDGSVEEPETDPDNENTYLITTPAELAWVAQQVNSKTQYFEGKTIQLMNDIDLSGSSWTPIGNVTAYPTVTFKGTFDGQNHIISNLTASDDAAGYAAAGLFGSILGTVKNVTLKNVDIRSTHYAGAVVGYSSTNRAIIENCHVDGGTITSVPENTGSAYDNGDKAGGIIGYYVTGDKVMNCTAKNLTITAYRDLGGITGCGPQSGMIDCSVENIILVQDNTNGYESEAVTTVGALGGRDVNKENKPYDGEFALAVTKKVVYNVSNDTQLADALAAAAIADNAIIYLTKGEYTIPSSLTFVGTGDAANTIIECKNDGYDNLNGSTVTFENLTIETDNETYRGFIHVSGATYKNCIIKNQLTLYSDGDPLLFDNCTFNASGNNYNVWTWGTSATFNDCTFDCDGKAMLVYGGGTSEVTFTNCIFNDLGGQNGKAAIETGNDYDATYTININKCTVNGFDVNSVSRSNVWGNKDSMTADKLNVIIDNVDVY